MSGIKDSVIHRNSAFRKLFRSRRSASRQQPHESEILGDGRGLESKEAVTSLKPANTPASAAAQDQAVAERDMRQNNGLNCETSSYINTGYYVPLDTVLRCWKVGCVFCELLYGGMRTAGALYSRVRIDLSIEDNSVVRIHAGWKANWEIYRPMQGLEQLDFQKATTSLGPPLGPFGAKTIIRSDPVSWIGQRPDLVRRSDSDACFVRVRGWLSHCQNDHPLCRTHDGSRLELPKRLIDVRNPECIRLCEASGLLATYVSYATLSHCWGNPGMPNLCVTQTRTLDQHSACILWSNIPKTFRDAIVVTRRLGLGFLWIDSLCIVQDDMGDWAEESAKMSRIYANAVLTIAASAAENATEGFLGVRHSREENINTSPEKTLPLRIRQDVHASDPDHSRILLNTRGWVFQERLLSRRILHFEKDEIIWECRTAQACECGSDLPPLSSQPASLRTAYTFLYESMSKAETYAWWRNVVVDQYSDLNLTKWTDRLPALSGLAAVVRQKTQDVYLAGLWLSDLAYGLLWRPLDYREALYVDNANGFHAPSWSWVHIKGPVSHERRLLTTTYVQFNGHSIELATVDPTGAISAGILDLQVPLFQLEIEGSKKIEIYPLNDDSHQVIAEVFLDSPKSQRGLMGLALIGMRRDRINSQFCAVSFFGVVVGNYHVVITGQKTGQRVGHWSARFSERVSSPYNEAVIREYMTRLILV